MIRRWVLSLHFGQLKSIDMATIKIKGKLDLDLTKIGLKAGDIIRNATYSESNGAINFDFHYVINNECVVYPENYEIIKLSENEKENII
jgi:hypothetical protein